MVRTAALDCREPRGKSAGPRTIAPSIARFLLRLNDLLFIRCLSTVGDCCIPRTIAPSIARFLLRLNDLLFIRCLSTVGDCCTYGVLKPSWQGARFRVCFHLLPRHPLE